MRGSGMRRSWMCAAAWLGGASAALADCAPAARCAGVACAPACPRDADRDASGRCACRAGDALVLGACVPPAVGDDFCGPGARITSGGGCVFRSCLPDEVLDVATGVCTGRALLPHGGELVCGPGSMPAVENGRGVCVSADAACPRGTVGAATAGEPPEDGGVRERTERCQGPVRCPPGTLADIATCRPIVTESSLPGVTRVDLGAWAALVLGVDGAVGSPLLCRPLAQRPALFGLAGPARALVHVRVALRAPDQDVSRASAAVRTSLGAGSPAAEAWVLHVVQTALEALRGLGGQSSTAGLEVEVRCPLGGDWSRSE